MIWYIIGPVIYATLILLALALLVASVFILLVFPWLLVFEVEMHYLPEFIQPDYMKGNQ